MELHLGGLTIKIDSVLISGSPCVKRNGKMRTEKSIKGERRGENARRSIYIGECISRLVTEENARPPLSLVAFPSSLSSLACTRELSSLAANGVTPGSGNAIHEGLCNDTDAGGTSVLTSLDDNTTRNESSMRAVSGLAIIPSWNLSASFLTRSLYRIEFPFRSLIPNISMSCVFTIIENSANDSRWYLLLSLRARYPNRTLKLSFDNSWYILKHGDSFPSSPSDVSRLAFSQVNFNFYAYKFDNRMFLFTVKIL